MMLQTKNIRNFSFVLGAILILSSCTDNEPLLNSNTSNPKDSIAITAYNKAFQLSTTHQYDSAYHYYYQSLLRYKKNKNRLWISEVYYKLALLDYKNSNYIASESNCINALSSITDPKQGKEEKARAYNLLGLIAKKQKHYKEALSSYNSSKDLLVASNFGVKKQIDYFNNIANVYQEKEDFIQSITYYDSILQIDSVFFIAPIRYARALDNKAWSLFLNNKQEKAFPVFEKSLKIRKAIKNKPGVIMSYLHLAHYYLNKKENKTAYNYALKTYKLCTEIHDSSSQLEALILLAATDKENANDYFRKYSELQNILIEKERQYKDQTAKIRYKTAQKEKQITAQHVQIDKKNKALLWGTIASALIGFSALFFLFQKIKISKQRTQIQDLKKEVHHNIKNDLERTISFLNEAKKQPSKRTIEDLELRVKSMLNLHQQIYSSDTGDLVNMQEYLERICKNVHRGYHTDSKKINYTISTSIYLPAKKAELIGIIANELITNIYKYAFPNKTTGKYTITLDKEIRKIQLLVCDNGIGFPKEFDEDKISSFGLNMIKGLAKQLDTKNGKITFETAKNENCIRLVCNEKE